LEKKPNKKRVVFWSYKVGSSFIACFCF